MIDLSINTQEVHRLLVDFIRQQAQSAKRNHLVIGLSGGIDSALSCYLSVDALGADNVFGVRMPYTTSTPESLEHAQLVIEATGIQSLTIPIAPMADPLIQAYPEMDALRKGNIMARTRMIVLYDQSSAFDGLVVGTGNKTEAFLGYTTLFGDSACAFNPLGDLFKTQVRQLAREMKIPEVIIQKPPSADLWVGQTDEGELGFTYQEVDQLLHLLIDLGKTPAECEREGFRREFIDQVSEKVRSSLFKRMPAPIAKIS